MAIQGIVYRYCPTGSERYLGIDDATGELVGHPTLGPDPGGFPIADDDYDFDASCKVASDLIYTDANYKVYVKQSYPYGTVVEIASPPPDKPPPGEVCALQFMLNSIATNESTPGAADGTITAVAKDADVTKVKKFNLGSDFDYNTGGVTGSAGSTSTLVFTGLVQGTYTVYVRTSTTCMKMIELTVGLSDLYNTLYQLDYNDVDGSGTPTKYRLLIDKKLYAGSLSEVEGSGSPVAIGWRNEAGEDIFDAVVPVEFNVTLNSKTDQQFIGLYTTDEREIRGTLYEYISGSYVERWQGFLLPMLYSEPYNLQKEYDVNLTFIDLGSLANEPFTSSGGTNLEARLSIMDALVIILGKTGLELPIWESANLYTTGMSSTNADSMLTQCYFDPKVYMDSAEEPLDCLTTLKALMFNWGLRLYQADGHWNIELITQKLASSVLTRKFSNLGVYDSNASLTPRIPLRRAGMPAPRVTFAENSQRMSIPQQYGKIKVIYDLGTGQKNNLLLRGEFKEEDIANGQFLGWQVTPETGSNATFGLEKLTEDRNGVDTALYIDFANTAPDKYVDIVSAPVNLTWPGAAYILNLKFDVYTRPAFKETHIFLDFTLGLNNNSILLNPAAGIEGDAFVSPYNAGHAWVDNIYNRVLIDNHLSWKQVNLRIKVSGSSTNGISSSGPMALQLRVRSNPKTDFASLTALKAAPTIISSLAGKVNREKYPKARVLDTSFGQVVVRTYSLQTGAANSASEPDIVIPDDYESVSSPKNLMHWKLEQTVADQGVNNWLQSMLLTNMEVSYLPGRENPQETITKEILMTPNVKRTYERTLLHGDITPEMDANYSYISNGHLTLADGTLLTGGWYRKGSAESYLLHELVAAMYQGQYQGQRWKLMGSLDPQGVTPSFFNTFQEYRSGKVYLPVSMTYDTRQNLVEVEMIEALAGTAVVDEGDPEVPVVEPPVSLREHTIEFTNEFS